jgi:hypothetical protein
MKKINRYASYFKYSTPATGFEVKAVNERNRKVRISLNETSATTYPFYVLHLQPDKIKDISLPREDDTLEFSFNIANLPDDHYVCSIYGSKNGIDYDSSSRLIDIDFKLDSEDDIKQVRLGRAGFEQTDDEIFWDAIKERQLNFNDYCDFINRILYLKSNDFYFNNKKTHDLADQGPFIGIREYNLLKFGTAFFMLNKSALDTEEIKSYLGNDNILPYYEHLSDSYKEAEKEYPEKRTEALTLGLDVDFSSTELSEDEELILKRFRNPFFIELIWSYWMEQGMLMQAMNLISFRFQNINAGNIGQVTRFDVSPLRPLSHILWGFIQDEQHRLSLPRRIQEYDHEYGLMLMGKAAPPFVPSDSRSKFLEAFHNLLTTTSIFYKEADDTTRIADAFPVLNGLKEVHLLLAEGNHNAYGNLTWTARHEMMMSQYILARDEVRQFLGGRPMVPYPERWMDRIDTVRNIMGWGSTSITYFYDLAIHGEKILLAIRYGDWSDANVPVAAAANWAMAFRDSVQKYIHAYRTVTGVELSADASLNSSSAKTIQPSILIQRRVIEERSRQRRA